MVAKDNWSGSTYQRPYIAPAALFSKWLDGWQESWVNCPVRTFFSLCTTPLKLRFQISGWNTAKKILVRWSNSPQTLPTRPTKKSINTLKWLNTHFYGPLVINWSSIFSMRQENSAIDFCDWECVSDFHVL